MALHPIDTIARDFLAAGGRLMIDPAGRYRSAISAERILGLRAPTGNRRACQALSLAEDDRRSRARLRAMIRTDGELLENGWRLLRA